MYADKFKINANVLVTKLWGDNFFNSSTRKWQHHDEKSTLERAFVSFIMKPITSLVRNIHSGEPKELESAFKKCKALGINITSEDKNLSKKDLMRHIMGKWISAADALIEMIICKLPSPK